jgi:hypothetical protein
MAGSLLPEPENFLGSTGQQTDALLRIDDDHCTNHRFAQNICEIQAFAAKFQLAVFFFSHSDGRFEVVADRKKLVPQANFAAACISNALAGMGCPRLDALKELTRKNHVTEMYPTCLKIKDTQ